MKNTLFRSRMVFFFFYKWRVADGRRDFPTDGLLVISLFFVRYKSHTRRWNKAQNQFLFPSFNF